MGSGNLISYDLLTEPFTNLYQLNHLQQYYFLRYLRDMSPGILTTVCGLQFKAGIRTY